MTYEHRRPGCAVLRALFDCRVRARRRGPYRVARRAGLSPVCGPAGWRANVPRPTSTGRQQDAPRVHDHGARDRDHVRAPCFPAAYPAGRCEGEARMTWPQTAERANQLLTCGIGEAADERLVGGKARNLARLIALGMPVPNGVVLTSAAFERFLDANALRDRIDTLCHGVNSTDMAALHDRACSIASLVASAAIPDEIQRLIGDIPNGETPDTLWVARSSAVGEDGERASFAGQLDSVLNLQAEGDLLQAVLTCWASYWSERSLFYRTARGASLNGMAVIIQRQVAARVSGVLFSRAPSGVTGAGPDDLMIEYCAGLGDALVSGRLEPGRLIVSRADLAVRSVAEIPPADATENIQEFLTPRRILDLARHALRLEKEFGAPQDIEWSIDAGGELWILQSRPITTSRAPERERATAVWSNANVNENFPQPISPLLYSIASTGYYHYFRNLGRAFGVSRWRLDAMEQPLVGIMGVHGGRMYYNLTNIHSILRMAPFGEPLAPAFNQFVCSSYLTAPPSGALKGSGPRNH